MTVEQEVANLTTSVDSLTEAVNVKKSTLDASVTDSEAARDQSQAARDTAEDHKLAAEAAATSATNTAASLTGFDLDAIAASKADTAVDVFVYDTSKDSDGGAWRHRTQGTSWYNETLNTATRGSRREFPAVAVIVAEAGKVTIYDGDDPSLPMWAELNMNTTFKSACAVNGSLSFATTAGILSWSLISERLTRALALGLQEQPWTRDGAGSDFATIDAAAAIVSNTVNDVAMTVLPDAPIDPATGLPVPTIAVATDGGVSVIKDDGTVVDSSFGSAFTAVNFTPAGDLVGGIEGAKVSYVYTDYSADSFTPAEEYDEDGDVNIFSAGSNPQKITLTSLPSDFLVYGHGATDRDGGLFLIQRDKSTPTNGMVAHTTSTYNTGWMNGDIKGAFLSDTDDTDLVGSGELVTNGEDWTGATGNTPPNGWTKPGDLTQYTITAGGALQIDRNGEGGTNTAQDITTVAGKTYVLSFDVVDDGGLNVAFQINNSTVFSESGTGNKSVTFVATSSTTSIGVRPGSSPIQVIEIDNISVKLADEDRSVNNNGLIVNGTVTRTFVDEV